MGKKIPANIYKNPYVYLDQNVGQRLWMYCEEKMLNKKKVASMIISHYLDSVDASQKVGET